MYYLKGMSDVTTDRMGGSYNPFDDPPRSAPKQNARPVTAAQAVVIANPVPTPAVAAVVSDLKRIENVLPSQKLSELKGNLEKLGLGSLPVPQYVYQGMDKIIGEAKNASYLDNRNGITSASTSENMSPKQFNDFKNGNGFVNLFAKTAFSMYMQSRKTSGPLEVAIKVPSSVAGLLTKLGSGIAGDALRNWDSFIGAGSNYAAAQQLREKILDGDKALDYALEGSRAALKGQQAYSAVQQAVTTLPQGVDQLADDARGVVAILNVPVQAGAAAVQKLGEKLDSAAVDAGVIGQYWSAFKDDGLLGLAGAYTDSSLRSQVQAQLNKFKQTGKYERTPQDAKRKQSIAQNKRQALKAQRELRDSIRRHDRQIEKSLRAEKLKRDREGRIAAAEFEKERRRKQAEDAAREAQNKRDSQRFESSFVSEALKSDAYWQKQYEQDVKNALAAGQPPPRPPTSMSTSLPSPSIATEKPPPLGGAFGPSGWAGASGPTGGGIDQRPEPAPVTPYQYTPPVDPMSVFASAPALNIQGGGSYDQNAQFWNQVLNTPGGGGWSFQGTIPYQGIDTLSMPSSPSASQFAGLGGLNMLSGAAEDSVALYYDLRSKGVDKMYANEMRSVAASISAKNWDDAYSKLTTLVGTVFQVSPDERLAQLRGEVSRIPTYTPPKAVTPKGEYSYDYTGGKTVVKSPTGKVLYSGKTTFGPAGTVSRGGDDDDSGIIGWLVGGIAVFGLVYLTAGKKKGKK